MIFLTLLCAATAYQLAAPTKVEVIEQPPVSPKEKAQRKPREIDQYLIRRIACPSGEEDMAVGTAWVIDEDTMVTAAHVVNDAQAVCYDLDANLPIIVTHLDWHNDFALVRMETGPLPEYISYSCEGFRSDQHYMASGWAHGETMRQTFLWSQKYVTDKNTYIDDMRAIGLRFLDGKMYKGMSGGPVFDDYGVAVGINSAKGRGNESFSRDLRDTVLCGKPRRNDPQHSDIFKD